MGTNDKVADGIKDAKHDNMDRLVRGGIDGESKGVEAVVLERDHEISSGVPFTIFVEAMLYGEPWWVPDAVRVKRKCDDPEDKGDCIVYPSLPLISSVFGTNEKIGFEGL